MDGIWERQFPLITQSGAVMCSSDEPYVRRVVGKGFGNFVSYSRLGYSFLFGTEYLENDRLKFRVIKVTLFNIWKQRQWLFSYTEHGTQVCPNDSPHGLVSCSIPIGIFCKAPCNCDWMLIVKFCSTQKQERNIYIYSKLYNCSLVIYYQLYTNQFTKTLKVWRTV